MRLSREAFVTARRLLRSFPYSEYLFCFLPFLIYLGVNRKLALSASLQLVAFVLAIAAGFIYNLVCDASYDSPDKNPLAEEERGRKVALKLAVLLAALSIAAFVPFVESPVSILVMILYVVLWFAYSGMGVRLKETLASPFVASWLLWSGGPAILLINYRVDERPLLLLWASMFLFYAGNEINHQLGDYEEDKSRSVRTFTVRVGIPIAVVCRYCVVTTSLLIFSLSISSLVDLDNLQILLATIALLALFALFEILVYPDAFARFARIHSLQKSVQGLKKSSRSSPFVMMKFLLVIFLIISTGIGPWIGVSMIWILVTSRRG